MAQVYQLVDENGVTRLFVEIVPDPTGTPFNGGTITQPLTVDTSATGGFADILTVVNDNAVPGTGTSLVVGSFGSLTLTGTQGNRGSFVVTDGSAQLQLSTTDGVLTNASLPVKASGALITQLHAAPSDGSLAAGDCALWFDQTNGAAKLMVKAKQADGTVRTGSLALV